MKINFLYIVIFFIFIISLYNIFYKPSIYKLFNFNKKLSKILNIQNALFSDSKLFCSITGYKCDNEFCDCTSLCKGQYKKFNIYDNERVVMFNETLSPGTYCLPKGFEHCNTKTSIPIYSVTGWLCISKSFMIWNKDRLVACQNSYAKDNTLNYLVDTLTNEKVDDINHINNYYEVYNGKLRYQCLCNSLDKSNNNLIHLEDIPFKCVSDYCLAKLNFRRSVPGWDPRTKQCNCSYLHHENPNDLTSPCVAKAYQLKNSIFTGYINCTHSNSLKEYSIYCDEKEFLSLEFQKNLIFSNNPLEYLNIVV